MANFKNYGIQGIGSDVQLGKGGLRLTHDDGVLKVVSSTSSPQNPTLARIQVAPPQDGADAVTKTYLDDATAALDAAIKQVASTMPAVEADTVENGSKTVVLKATDAGFTLSGPGDAILTASGAEADVNLRLVPQGAGQVVIGPTGAAGMIQADDGQPLTIAGGDNALGAGGNLVLRAGQGQTNGFVVIHDLKDPVAPQDAATMAFVTSYVDSRDTKSLAGDIRTVSAAINETTGTVALGSITGTVVRVKVSITNAFTPGSTINVGRAAVANELADASVIDEAATGLYVIEAAQVYSTAADLVVTINALGQTGAGIVFIEYVQA